MYTGNKRNVVGVWVFTAYDDGEVDVTQTAPDRSRFAEVTRGIVRIAAWCNTTLKNSDKCPYSPKNTSVTVSEEIVDRSDAMNG